MTLVVDASVVAEVLLGTARHCSGCTYHPASRGARSDRPQHLTAEVASVVRGWSLSGHLSKDEALRAIREFQQLGVEQVPMIDRLPDVRALRHNLTAYDAMYVVLARVIGCRLLTLDARLAEAAQDCGLFRVECGRAGDAG